MKAHWLIGMLLLATPLLSQAKPGSEEKVSLSSMIELAAKNHPEIAALQARVDAARARKTAAPSIPPPSLSLGVTSEKGLFTSEGRMENSIEVNQTIPFPTKLTSESRAKDLAAQAAEEDLEAKLKSLRAEVRVAYFDLYRTRELRSLLQEKKQILESHNKRVRATSLSDRIVQAHLLRLQTEIELVQNEIDKTTRDEKVSQGTVDVLTGRDPSTDIAMLEKPALPEIPKAASDSGLDRHPQLRSLEKTELALQAESDRARAEWLPDLMIKYRSNRRFDGVMPNNSEVMVGIELPFLFFWQPRGKSMEAQARLAETQALLQKSRNDLKLSHLKARSDAESLRARVASFEERILPQAEKRMKISHSIAPTDMESLNEHRESMESLVDLRIASLALRAEYETAIATLESLETSP